MKKSNFVKDVQRFQLEYAMEMFSEIKSKHKILKRWGFKTNNRRYRTKLGRRRAYLPAWSSRPERSAYEHECVITLLEAINYGIYHEREKEWGDPVGIIKDPAQIILLHIIWGIEKHMPKPAINEPPPIHMAMDMFVD